MIKSFLPFCPRLRAARETAPALIPQTPTSFYRRYVTTVAFRKKYAHDNSLRLHVIETRAAAARYRPIGVPPRRGVPLRENPNTNLFTIERRNGEGKTWRCGKAAITASGTFKPTNYMTR